MIAGLVLVTTLLAQPLTASDFNDVSAFADRVDWSPNMPGIEPCLDTLPQTLGLERSEDTQFAQAQRYCFIICDPNAVEVFDSLLDHLNAIGFEMVSAEGPSATYDRDGESLELAALPAPPNSSGGTSLVVLVVIENTD